MLEIALIVVFFVMGAVLTRLKLWPHALLLLIGLLIIRRVFGNRDEE